MKAMFRGRMPRLHFIGIGGIGMSGIAEILLRHGYVVSGSDLNSNEVTQRLEALGAKVFRGHAAQNLDDAEVVVVSTAIGDDNPELLRARAENLPVVHRGEMLAELMRLKNGIAIAGSHGKTTTTSIVAHVLATAGLDPMAVVGGVVKNFGSNAKTGVGDFLVAEADESDGSFLQLLPTIAVVTNIDPEHLEHYPGGFPQLLAAFQTFVNSIPFYGLAVLCADHPNLRALFSSVKKRYVTYGLDGGDYTLTELRTEPAGVSFVPVRRGEALPRVTFPMIGAHHAQNALAVLAIADEIGIDFAIYKKALASFEGVGRRFELKGQVGSIAVYDDYGHHPAEIIATLTGARHAFLSQPVVGPWRRLVVVFQPHRYTRTRDLLREFGRAFDAADVVILTDVYAAGEAPIPGISGETIFAEVQRTSPVSVHYVADKMAVATVLHREVRAGDLVLTLGAGDIHKSGEQLLRLLEQEAAHG